MSDLSRTLMEIRKIRRQLKEIPGELESRERTIAEDENLTTEAKQIKTRQVRDQLRSRQRTLNTQMEKACARVDRLHTQTVVEGGTRTAHERARQLLKDGASFDAVIARAEKTGDSDTLRALMAARSATVRSQTPTRWSAGASTRWRGWGTTTRRRSARSRRRGGRSARSRSSPRRACSPGSPDSTGCRSRTPKARRTVTPMPEGNRSFVTSKGNRRKVTLLLPEDTCRLLRVAGGSVAGQATKLLEHWAERFLDANADELRRSVARERRARATRSGDDSRSTGRPVEGAG